MLDELRIYRTPQSTFQHPGGPGQTETTLDSPQTSDLSSTVVRARGTPSLLIIGLQSDSSRLHTAMPGCLCLVGAVYLHALECWCLKPRRGTLLIDQCATAIIANCSRASCRTMFITPQCSHVIACSCCCHSLMSHVHAHVLACACPHRCALTVIHPCPCQSRHACPT